MAQTSRRWLMLLVALAAAISVAAVWRPAGSQGEKSVASRSNNAIKAADRLNKALQTEYAEIRVSANPFGQPEEAKASALPKQSGVKMVGWARLNGHDYALVATASGEQYVQTGDDVAGWHVAKVEPEQMVLTQNGVSDVVKLSERFSVTPLGKP